LPEVPALRVRVAVRRPTAEGLNWMPSQQLVQGPVALAVKEPDGGWPWP
jgi:hypothetical protein